MGARATRLLHSVHKWAGLLSGINVFVLSVTGAYLVFDVEINRMFEAPRGDVVATVDVNGPTPLQAAIDGVQKVHPNATPTLLFWAKHEAGIMEMGLQGDGPNRYRLNMTTGEVYAVTDGKATAINRFIFRLHDDLLVGKPGSIFLGIVGILFLISTLTGIFIYGPFMKQAVFGVLRRDRGPRRFTAELHKLLGCVSLAFNVVIGVTGTVLTLGLIALRAWMGPAMLLAAQGGEALPPGTPLPAVDSVIARAAAAQPGKDFFTITYPGSLQGPNFYMCTFAKRDSVTRSIFAPSMVPVVPTSEVRVVTIPLWVKALYLCIPFHFGDFAGLGMKVVYCLFGLSSGVLSISGAVLSFIAWGKQWRVWRRARRAVALGLDDDPLRGEGA